MLSRSRPRPCTVQARRVYYRRTGIETTEWSTQSRCGSVRQAKADLPYIAARVVDRLSSADYDVRLVFDDGSTRFLFGAARWQWAIALAKRDQAHNSIGARLRRGETVVV